ncbi:MAG: hypothetical protein CVU89_06755 [Firmicutes bacterium HGW-Firmicutes-14]|nr:MAG: hypothetical protein CVU89_06755 [Firmicutes bacterium HGW-Firmicutes-14]
MRDINLLPQSYIEPPRKNTSLYLIALIVSILIFSFIYILSLYSELSQARNKSAVLQGTLGQLTGNVLPDGGKEKQVSIIRQLTAENPEISPLIKEVFEKAPPGFTLTRLTRFETMVIVISGTGNSQQQITNFTGELKKHPGFEGLAVVSIQETAPENYSFELQGSVKRGDGL